MQMKKCLVVLAILLFGLASESYGNNNMRLLSRAKNRIASLAQGTKQLFLKSEGKHALWQKLAMSAGIAILACTSINCGGGTALRGVSQQHQQYVRSPAEIMGRHVHFVSEGRHYIGYVHERIANDEVSIDLYDGNILNIKTDQVLGLRINDHPDERRQVLVETSEEGKTFLHAFVAAVYDDNYYELVVGAYVDDYDQMTALDSPYVILIYKKDIYAVFGEQF